MFDVIIPTKCIEPALTRLCESIQLYTRLGDGSLKFTAVGPTQPQIPWLKWIKHEGSVASSINEAISQTTEPYIIILHDDAVLLPQRQSRWIEQLKNLMSDPMVAVGGPMKINKNGVDFVNFFCAAISRSAWSKIGPLSLDFPYHDYDVEWCSRAQKAGYQIKSVGELSSHNGYFTGDFQIYHAGGHTLRHSPSPQPEPTKVELSSPGIVYSLAPHSHPTVPVTAHISTRGRYKTTLPLAIQSIALQSLVPKRLIIFDDGCDGQFFKETIYVHLFNMLQSKGCHVDVVNGEGKGQVLNHQKAIDMSNTPFIWRVDDDNSAEPNVLEKLLANMGDGVGAVAPCVHFPWITPPPLDISGSGLIGDVKCRNNVQWFKFSGLQPVEHLHNTFLFRKEAASHGYPNNLSVVGHREETIFSHEMVLRGWKLVVVGDAITWHLRDPDGGIRLFRDTSLWQSDETKFHEWATARNVKFNDYWLIVLDNGLGDHLAFVHVWPEIKEKARQKGQKVLLAVCYPEVFKNEPVISIADAMKLEKDLGKHNVYNFMIQNNWKKSLIDGFRAMYGL